MTAAAVSGHRTGIRRPTRRPVLVVSSAILGAVAVMSLGFAMKAMPGDMTLVAALNQLHTMAARRSARRRGDIEALRPGSAC